MFSGVGAILILLPPLVVASAATSGRRVPGLVLVLVPVLSILPISPILPRLGPVWNRHGLRRSLQSRERVALSRRLEALCLAVLFQSLSCWSVKVPRFAEEWVSMWSGLASLD